MVNMSNYDSEIKQLRSEIDQWESEREIYQRDFAILQDEEMRICQVIELFAELTSERNVLNTGFQHMAELHTENVSFPDMDILTDFSVPNGNASQLISFFDSYSHDLKRVCEEIDEKKAELGKILGRYYDKICANNSKIRDLENKERDESDGNPLT